jgi:hypothetical protein
MLYKVLAPQYLGARFTICILISSPPSEQLRESYRKTVTMSKRSLSPPDVVRRSPPLSHDTTDQARHETPQLQVKFPKILAIVPFIHVTGRKSEGGLAKVHVQCDTWVDQGYLEQIDSTLAKLEAKMRIMDADSYVLSVRLQFTV